MRFTGFHTAPTCSPTRSMLMSGVDNHEAGLGTMAELLGPATLGLPGYEGYLNDRVASIAELLRAGGYATLMAGKWHLGLTPEREPAARGFEHSFALLQGLSNHFGADQNEAWTKAGLAPSYRDDGKPATLPKGQYSADYFADRLIGYLDASAKAGIAAPSSPICPSPLRTGRSRRRRRRSPNIGAAITQAMKRCVPSDWPGKRRWGWFRPMPCRTASSWPGPGPRSAPTNGPSRRARWKSMPPWSTAWTRMSAG
ncbi:hypothetical protein GCM10020258_36330 [Sphingomonas yabuuchiae]